MITLTYALSGVLLALSGYLFSIGALSAQTQTIAWMVVFFFASPAASAAYLTVSETFPLEVRALAIALFYAVGTGIGGIIGPALFGVLIESGSRNSVFAGYLFGSILMIAAAGLAWRLCVASERRPLEDVARPLGRGRLGSMTDIDFIFETLSASHGPARRPVLPLAEPLRVPVRYRRHVARSRADA